MSASTSFVLFAWLCIAAFTRFVAEHRGRSGIRWAALGLVFGLFALLVCACLPRRPATEPESEWSVPGSNR